MKYSLIIENYHPVSSGKERFVSVILPISIPKAYTYLVPEEWISLIQFGIRVEVEFGKSKRYAGLIVEAVSSLPDSYTPKPILTVLDEKPIIDIKQYQLWQWMAAYYACTIGEIMNAALPGNLKLTSETIVTLGPFYDPNLQGLSDEEFLLCEALSIQHELSIQEVKNILDKKDRLAVYPIINKLLEKRIIYVKEELVKKYKPKSVTCVQLHKKYRDDPSQVAEVFELTDKAEKQQAVLMAYFQMSKENKFIKRSELVKRARTTASTINTLVKKNIFELYDKTISRLDLYNEDTQDTSPLTPQQSEAIKEINTVFKDKNVCLLHGVTGSGKTRVYVEMMKHIIQEGGQVLYLVPEIALTVQIVSRVQKIFGEDVQIFHSRLNSNERVEIWHQVQMGKSILMGVRSSIFLPFKNLKLIVIDEEHDTSYKQKDPAPRYNARDTSIYLAHLHGAKVLMGTATPAIETYYNAKKGKYGLVEMKKRYGEIQMPQIELVDALNAQKKDPNFTHFTPQLIGEINKSLSNKEQVILFQNRRGYAPTIYCKNCSWSQVCKNCDVNLTYHQFSNHLRCHYCSYQISVPSSCPACGENKLDFRGFGTEKIEDELKKMFPKAKVARMDYDTIKGKNAMSKLIYDFEDKQIDILVGTQMVTKGLDFENVSLVGVLSADGLLQFPDFRSVERTFQLITQVSGRAGRKKKRGKVIVQAYNIHHPVLKEITDNDFDGFYNRELEERQAFNYPPFSRLIQITLKHRNAQKLNDATRLFTHILKSKLGDRVIGPAIPGISRIRGKYILVLMVKLEKNAALIKNAKNWIAHFSRSTKAEKGFSGVRINIDVDPQ